MHLQDQSNQIYLIILNKHIYIVYTSCQKKKILYQSWLPIRISEAGNLDRVRKLPVMQSLRNYLRNYA